MTGEYPKVEPARALAPGRVVELGVVCFASQVIVDDLPPATPARDVHPDVFIEAAGAEQGGVEVGGPVGGPDHKEVCRFDQSLW